MMTYMPESLKRRTIGWPKLQRLQSLEIDNVVRVFKKGETISLQKYISISLSSLVGKIFERIPESQIQRHLHKHEIAILSMGLGPVGRI